MTVFRLHKLLLLSVQVFLYKHYWILCICAMFHFCGSLLLLLEANMWHCATDGSTDNGLQLVSATHPVPTQYHSQVMNSGP
jgi:hypothetical protein